MKKLNLIPQSKFNQSQSNEKKKKNHQWINKFDEKKKNSFWWLLTIFLMASYHPDPVMLENKKHDLKCKILVKNLLKTNFDSKHFTLLWFWFWFRLSWSNSFFLSPGGFTSCWTTTKSLVITQKLKFYHLNEMVPFKKHSKSN